MSAYDKSHQEWIEYITVFKREIYDLSDQPAQQSSTRIRSVQHVSVSFEQTTNTERRKLVLLLWKNKPTTKRATYKSTCNSLVDRYLFQRDVAIDDKTFFYPSIRREEIPLNIYLLLHRAERFRFPSPRKKEGKHRRDIIFCRTRENGIFGGRNRGKKLARLFGWLAREGR